MEEWITTSRIENNYHIDRVCIDKLYSEFQKDNIVETSTKGWDKFKFLDRFF